MSSTTAEQESRYRAARRVTVVGAVANVLLAAGKVIVGFAAHSQSLIADGIHSLSDLISDGLVLVASKHGAKEADDKHPYGHARFETAATVGLGLLLILVAGGITWDAVLRLLNPELLMLPGWPALAAAIASVLIKEGLYHYTAITARRIKSDLLRANAWHHRSDAISSVVVIIGVAGSMAGIGWLDAVAAVGVGLMVAHIGIKFCWESMQELVDTGLEPEQLGLIRASITSVDGVSALHMLRTRRMGSEALVDVHILLSDSRMSVSEGHQISEMVRAQVIKDIPEVTQVLVHIDPENDEEVKADLTLPLRTETLKKLNGCWSHQEAAKRIEKVNLHYLAGKIQVELLLPLSLLDGNAKPEALTDSFRESIADLTEIGGIRLFFR